MTTLEEVAQVLIYLAAVPAIAFPFLYFFRSPWRNTAEGKTMMILGSALGLVFALIVANVATDSSYFGREYVRIGAYLYLVFALYRLCAQLLVVQHRQRTGYYDRPFDGGRCEVKS